MLDTAMGACYKPFCPLGVAADNSCFITHAGKIVIRIAGTGIGVAGTDARLDMICFKATGKVTDFYIIGNTAGAGQHKHLSFMIQFTKVVISGCGNFTLYRQFDQSVLVCSEHKHILSFIFCKFIISYSVLTSNTNLILYRRNG